LCLNIKDRTNLELDKESWQVSHERQSWIHNGSHRPPPYFEWWYIHFVTPEGVAINLVLHETDIFGQHDSPYLSMSVHRPGKPICYLKRALPLAIITRNRPYLQTGSELLAESKRSIFFDVDFPGEASLKGEMVKLAPRLVFGNGILFADSQTGRTSYWMIAAPHASFTAQLHLDGTVLNLEGMAYQDHQWGTLPLQDMVADWTWGHFSNPQMAAVFFQIRTQRGQLIQRVGVTTAGGRFTDTSLDSEFLKTLSNTVSPEEYSDNVEVDFFSKNLQLEFAISPTKLMRWRINEPLGNRAVSYLRWAATGAYQDACARHDVYGISEYIRVRPGAYGSLPESEYRQYYLWDHDGD
jgi:hypothetical protein